MQNKNLLLCNMDVLSGGSEHFWMKDLEGILEDFPFLESPHKNDFFTVLLINQAQGEIMVDTEKIDLTTAKVIIIKPGCINHIRINNESSGKMICFTEEFFSLRYNSNVLNQFSFLEREAIVSFRFTNRNRDRVDVITSLLQEEYRLHGNMTQKVLRSYLNIFLFEIERIYSPYAMSKNRNSGQEKILEFEKLVEKNFATKKLPSSYAELLNVSANYLNKLCKKETGQTAGDIIRKHIIIEAQRLLYYTHLTINEIADQLGFENASYFVTTFKKYTLQTPEQFRKNQNL